MADSLRQATVVTAIELYRPSPVKQEHLQLGAIEAIDVPCPICRAEPGEVCISAKRAIRELSHARRRQRADRAAGRAESYQMRYPVSQRSPAYGSYRGVEPTDDLWPASQALIHTLARQRAPQVHRDRLRRLERRRHAGLR